MKSFSILVTGLAVMATAVARVYVNRTDLHELGIARFTIDVDELNGELDTSLDNPNLYYVCDILGTGLDLSTIHAPYNEENAGKVDVVDYALTLHDIANPDMFLKMLYRYEGLGYNVTQLVTTEDMNQRLVTQPVGLFKKDIDKVYLWSAEN